MERTAGRTWGLIGGLTLAVFLQPLACGPGEAVPPSDNTDPVEADVLTRALQDAWPSAIEPAVLEARDGSVALTTSLQDWHDVLAAGEDDTLAYQSVQDAWWDMMASWQVLEVMQIGPIGASLTVTGGADLRDEGYSWPTVNSCAVDQETVLSEWEDTDFIQRNVVNVYGLDALETLIFSPQGENSCVSLVNLNADGIWTSFTTSELDLLRAEYALALGQNLLTTIDGIQSAWAADADGFATAFTQPGTEASPFIDQTEALNAIFDAMFYLDKSTKDRKLGGPLGRWDCGSDSCLNDIETTMSGSSHLWFAPNIEGFRRLFTGGDATGMDDILVDLGYSDVTDAMLVALDEAEIAANNLTMPVEQALIDAPEQAEALHDALSAITDILKGDLVTVLALQIPLEALGDND